MVAGRSWGPWCVRSKTSTDQRRITSVAVRGVGVTLILLDASSSSVLCSSLDVRVWKLAGSLPLSIAEDRVCGFVSASRDPSGPESPRVVGVDVHSAPEPLDVDGKFA